MEQDPPDKGRNYRIGFGVYQNSVPIYRRLSCPVNASFYKLHWALARAFECHGTLTYHFGIDGGGVRQPEIYIEETGDEDSYAEDEDNPFKVSEVFWYDEVNEEDTTQYKSCETTKLWHVYEDPRYKEASGRYQLSPWNHATTMNLKRRDEKTEHFEIVGAEGRSVESKDAKPPLWLTLESAYATPDQQQTKEMRDTKRWYLKLLDKGQAEESLDEAGFFTGLEATNLILKKRTTEKVWYSEDSHEELEESEESEDSE